MKKIVLLISVAAMALFASSKVSAQGKFGPDSAECIKYLSYYTEYYKQKNYDSALPNWRKAYSLCPPTARYSMLSDGTTLLRRLIQQNQKNAVYKAKLVDSLMTIYDQRVEFWPKYATTSLNNKASDMYNYIKNDPQRLYEGLTDVVNRIGPYLPVFVIRPGCVTCDGDIKHCIIRDYFSFRNIVGNFRISSCGSAAARAKCKQHNRCEG